MPFTVHVRDMATVAYDEAFALQKRTVKHLQDGEGEETLYLLEHPHVITRGRNATLEALVATQQLLEQRGVALVETDRGGDATYHGPGQLVGYPIIHLQEGRRDVRRFVRDLEEALMRTLAEFGIEARRDPVHRGVWVGRAKIASVGIRISRWVTCHGFALNVNTDLSFFSLIVPCGIAGCEMTSMSRVLGHPVDMAHVKARFAEKFGEVYERELMFDTPTSTMDGSNG